MNNIFSRYVYVDVDLEKFKMLSNNIVIAASFGRKVATEQFLKQKFDTFERTERCREFEMNY